MSNLAWIAVVLGGVGMVLYAFCVFLPARSCRWIQAFPRSRPAAWFLTAVDLSWAIWLLYHTSLGFAEGLKPFFYILGPAAFFMIVFLMDELLAPRALGALLVLVPVPMLMAARELETGSRFIMVVLAYLLVIKGVLLVLNPFLFRKGLAFWVARPERCFLLGLLGMGLGLILVILGITVY